MNNIKSHIKFAGIILLFLMYSCSEDTIEEGQTGTLTGNVVSMGDNLPLANVKITTQPSSSTVFTDELGEFIIPDILVEQYSVQAEKEGYLVDFESTNVLANKTVNVVFELQISTANNKPPAKPILIAPEMNTEGAPLSVEFIWNPSIDPDEDDELTYKLTLQNDQNNTIEVFEDLTATTLTVSTLTFSTKYFWSVSVSDQINEPVISETSNFKTLSTPEYDYLAVRKIGSNNVIYSAKEDGSLLQLTTEWTNSWRPRKNTTTHKIAYLQSVGGETHLFTMNQDGSNVFQVTSTISVSGNNLNEIDFSWSSNGDRLLYSHYDKLYVINKDGSGLQAIYQTPDGSNITECDWSNDESMIALKTNDNSGYNVAIYTIDMLGNILTTVLSGVDGAAGGLNISVDNKLLLYTYDTSEYESVDNRQLDSHIFVYEFATDLATDISLNKLDGTNDLDPRFSPNEAEVIFVNTSNDGISTKSIYRMDLDEFDGFDDRTELFIDTYMPDWE